MRALRCYTGTVELSQTAPDIEMLHAQGLTVRDIAKQCGTSASTVWRRLKAAGLVTRRAKAGVVVAPLTGQQAAMGAYLEGRARQLLELVEERLKGLDEKATPGQVSALVTAGLRAIETLAKLTGIEPLKLEALELRRRQLQGAQGLAEQLAAFWGSRPALCPPPQEEVP